MKTFNPDELRGIIESAITNQPRSLQKMVGPSELGIECDRCIWHKTHQTPQKPQAAAWLPYIGTAMHEQLELLFTRNAIIREKLGQPWRWQCETPVTVGQIGGQNVTGSADLFDTETGTVIDWKVVGTTTLRSAKASGPSSQYRTQAHLYGQGFVNAGETVTGVCIYYLPRNAVSLADGYAWHEPWQQPVATAALERANRVWSQTLDQQPPHTGAKFACEKYDDYQPAPISPRTNLFAGAA